MIDLSDAFVLGIKSKATTRGKAIAIAMNAEIRDIEVKKDCGR